MNMHAWDFFMCIILLWGGTNPIVCYTRIVVSFELIHITNGGIGIHMCACYRGIEEKNLMQP